MTQHLDSDRLADLQEGLLDPAAATEAARHLSSCETCRQDADALSAVTAALAAAPPVEPMPADVAARLDAAFAAEHARALDPSREVGAAVELPGVPGRRPSAPDVIPLPVPATRRWWASHRVLQAAAVAVLVMAGGAAVLPALQNAADTAPGTTSAKERPADASAGDTGAAQESLAEPEPAAGGSTPIVATGDDYRPATLSQQVLDLLAAPERLPRAESQDVMAAKRQAMNDPAAVEACVAALPVTAPNAVLVDNARFNGRPATIIVVQAVSDPELLQVFVVDPACSARDAQVLHQGKVLRR